jgi:hypothetical protein
MGCPESVMCASLARSASSRSLFREMVWIVGTDEVSVGRTWPSQGNGAPEGRVGYGERAIVSNSSIF